jgi:hypothetical protein
MDCLHHIPYLMGAVWRIQRDRGVWNFEYGQMPKRGSQRFLRFPNEKAMPPSEYDHDVLWLLRANWNQRHIPTVDITYPCHLISCGPVAEKSYSPVSLVSTKVFMVSGFAPAGLTTNQEINISTILVTITRLANN